MPKKKPTHLYKLEDISGSDMLTYQFSLASGEEGPEKLRSLMQEKITQLLTERCSRLIETHVVLAGCLTYITVQSDHAEARGCIIDGVATAHAEFIASAATEEQKLTTMVTRTAAEFGCEQVTISYTTTVGWTVHQPNVSLVAGSPVIASHDASTQSVVIRSGNPLYHIDEETIGQIIEALRVSVAKTVDVEMRQMIRNLGAAAVKVTSSRRSMITNMIESFEASPGGNHYYNASRYYDGGRIQKFGYEPQPIHEIHEKVVPERDSMALQGWEQELLGGYRSTYETKIMDPGMRTIGIGGGYEPVYPPSDKGIYPPGGASKSGF